MIIEGDGDNTLIARLKSQCGLSVVKRLDKNHCVKNIIKTLYDLRNSKVVKISNQIIQHLSKCIKYIFSKNQGDKEGMRENLVALVPHQFGDHSKCHGRFCGYKRKPNLTKFMFIGVCHIRYHCRIHYYARASMTFLLQSLPKVPHI